VTRGAFVITPLLAAVLAFDGAEVEARAVISIKGTRFLVNGVQPCRGTALRGTLPMLRAANGIFDDRNPRTRRFWRYPDTRRWHPRRNTQELAAAFRAYRSHGLRAVTVNLQGGNPRRGHDHRHPWRVSAYRADGSLRPAWLARAATVLRAADRNGLVVVLGLFYNWQDERLANERAVLRATDNVVRWLLRRRHRNVLVEVTNETDWGYDHAILRPERVHELIRRIRVRSRGRLKASASFAGTPPRRVIAAADFVLIHDNSRGAERVRDRTAAVRSSRSYRRRPKPIVFSEGTRLEGLRAAANLGVSWGYHEKGAGNYRDGFQAPPINWRINTPSKREFFVTLGRLCRRR
jgi:hypothetical protein